MDNRSPGKLGELIGAVGYPVSDEIKDVKNMSLVLPGEPDLDGTRPVIWGGFGLPEVESWSSERQRGSSTRIALGPVQGCSPSESSMSEEGSESEDVSRPNQLRGLGELTLLTGETLVLEMDIEEGVDALCRSLTATVSGL